jgi:cytochrome c oxidase assembly protein subunit 15
MVEWRPLIGILPPISVEEWDRVFNLYKQYPEYQKINLGITLGEFKTIFLMEYAHRLVGRLIGIAFFIPMVWFWVKKQMPNWLKTRSVIILALGGLQGLMGWYMVKSGLIDMPAVSHYRLTIHLMLAILILGMLAWTAFQLTHDTDIWKPSSVTKMAFATLGILIITMIFGGFVAGKKAGLIYNTYPSMGGKFLPSEWADLSPLWLNFFENDATIQFVHRWLAIVVLLKVMTLGLSSVKKQPENKVLHQAVGVMISTVFLQVILGILAICYRVPITIGTLHQGVAALLITSVLWVTFQAGLQKQSKQSYAKRDGRLAA